MCPPMSCFSRVYPTLVGSAVYSQRGKSLVRRHHHHRRRSTTSISFPLLPPPDSPAGDQEVGLDLPFLALGAVNKCTGTKLACSFAACTKHTFRYKIMKAFRLFFLPKPFSLPFSLQVHFGRPSRSTPPPSPLADHESVKH